MSGPNGKTAVVRTGWITENDSGLYRLTTIFVLQEYMMYQVYDKVVLKDGRIAIITDFFKDNYSCVFEIQNNDDNNLILGTIDEIKQIIWKRQQTKPAFYRRAFFCQIENRIYIKQAVSL